MGYAVAAAQRFELRIKCNWSRTNALVYINANNEQLKRYIGNSVIIKLFWIYIKLYTHAAVAYCFTSLNPNWRHWDNSCSSSTKPGRIINAFGRSYQFSFTHKIYACIRTYANGTTQRGGRGSGKGVKRREGQTGTWWPGYGIDMVVCERSERIRRREGSSVRERRCMSSVFRCIVTVYSFVCVRVCVCVFCICLAAT